MCVQRNCQVKRYELRDNHKTDSCILKLSKDIYAEIYFYPSQVVHNDLVSEFCRYIFHAWKIKFNEQAQILLEQYMGKKGNKN